MVPEPSLGLMLHGYNRSDAILLRDSISECMGVTIETIDASGMDETSVMEVIDQGGSDLYLESDMKVMMFLGFDDDGIGRSMDTLRSVRGIERPIFCCLTEENAGWKLKDLFSDLLEEDRYWRSRKATESSQNSPG